MILFSSSANADEIRELSMQARGCISEPDGVHNGIDRLKANGDQVIFSSNNRLFDAPNKENSPNGFLIAAIIGWYVKWVAIVDTTSSPPIFYNGRSGEGALFWTGLPKNVQTGLTKCGFEFGGDRGKPLLKERSKPERSYPEFHLPKMDWD